MSSTIIYVKDNEASADQALQLNELGIICEKVSDYEKAKEYYNQSLNINRRLYKNDEHASIAGLLTSLGNVNECLGEHEEARDLYEQALMINEKLSLKDDQVSRTHIASLLFKLGFVHDKLGYEPKIVRGFYERCLKMYGDEFREDNPLLASTLMIIGNFYDDQGEYEKAREFYYTAIDMTEELSTKASGNDSVELQIRRQLADLYNSLGHVEYNLRETKRAIDAYEKSLKLNRQLDDRSLNIAYLYGSMSNVYEHQNDLVKAIEYREKARTMHSDLGNKDEEASDFYRLGLLCGKTEDYRRQREMYEKSLQMNKETEKDPNEPRAHIALIYYNLGRVCSSHLNENEKGIDYFIKSLEMNTKLLKTKVHRICATILSEMAEAYEKLGESEKSDECRLMSERIERKLSRLHRSLSLGSSTKQIDIDEKIKNDDKNAETKSLTLALAEPVRALSIEDL